MQGWAVRDDVGVDARKYDFSVAARVVRTIGVGFADE